MFFSSKGPSFDFIGVSKAEGDDLAAKIEPDGSVDGSTGVNKVETFPVLTSKSKVSLHVYIVNVLCTYECTYTL